MKYYMSFLRNQFPKIFEDLFPNMELTDATHMYLGLEVDVGNILDLVDCKCSLEIYSS